MEIHDYIRIGRRWLPRALFLSLIFGALTYVLTNAAIHKQYVSTVTMEVQLGLPTSGSQDPNAASLYAATEAAIANQGRIVGQAAAQATHVVPAQDSRLGIEGVSCSPQGTTALFSCSVTSRSPAFAAAVANGLARAFISSENAWQQSRYTQVINYMKQQIATARRTHNNSALQVLGPLYPQVQLDAAQQANLARLVTPAGIPSAPSSPHPLLNALVAFTLILFLVMSAGTVADRLDDSVRGEDELKALTRLPILGLIPTISGMQDRALTRKTLVVSDSPRSPVGEPYRATRTSIVFSTVDRPIETLLFASAIPDEGKSTVALNVAAAFAEAGKTVILLDLDLWHRSISKVFEAPDYGVTNLLITGHADLSSYLLPSGIPNLSILPTGPIPPNPAELIGSRRMSAIMSELKGMADLIVVDSPALLAVSDAAVVATLCDTVVLVVRPSSSQRRSLMRAVDMLQSGGISIAGLVVNSYGKSDTGSYYYDTYSRSSKLAPKSDKRETRSGVTGETTKEAAKL
jgi:protein-tyrosine kinase